MGFLAPQTFLTLARVSTGEEGVSTSLRGASHTKAVHLSFSSEGLGRENFVVA